MQAIIDYFPALAWGVVTTVWVSVASILGCAIVSLVLGTAMRLRGFSVRVLTAGAVELLRGASVLIYLFWGIYALPLIPGAPQFSPLVTSILVLALVGGAYGGEIVSGGLQAVPAGQIEAAKALGLAKFQILLRVTLPQALAQIVPAFASLAIDMVKWTSVVSFIGVPDLLYVANSVRSISYETVPVYLMLALVYWALCTLTGALFQLLEWSLPISKARRAVATPPSPWPSRDLAIAAVQVRHP